MVLLDWLRINYSVVVVAIGLLISFIIGFMLYGVEGTKLVLRRAAVNLLLCLLVALFFSSDVGSVILSNINDRAVWTKHYVGRFLREKNVIN